MASVLYNSFKMDLMRGNIDWDNDTFYAMLVTSAYAPVIDTDNRRDDVTNEVIGTGYVTGGAEIVATLSVDNINDKAVVDFADVEWPGSTITARGAVIYKSTGVAANDPLVGYIDFGADKSSVGGTFTLTVTSPLELLTETP